MKITKKQTTKRQFEIIQAAGKILINAGVSGLTTKKLAQEMGFSESALYRHFKSKHDIIAAMLDYLAENMQNRFDEVVSENHSPSENFRAVFNNQFEFFNDNPFFVIAILSDGLIQESPTINKSIESLIAIKSQKLVSIIKQGQAQKAFTDAITAEQTVHIVMGSFRLLMLKWRMADFKFNLLKQGHNAVETMLKLLEKS